MKRLIILAALVLVFKLFLGNGFAYSQASFKIPVKFEVEDKSYPPGNYLVAQKEEGKISLREVTGDEEILLPVIKKLEQSDPPITEPQLIFDMVANFEPSYTEYVTEYLLAEVWLTEKDGFLVLAGERSEYNKSVKGEKAKK
ncbi:MAG: hypothetical protein JSV17_08435 [Candidatus Aminicenantes bacterium]|nr:MAG: hypothetical protein JSV17_08435 [Candidatus Aminicenantes bacterium]